MPHTGRRTTIKSTLGRYTSPAPDRCTNVENVLTAESCTKGQYRFTIIDFSANTSRLIAMSELQSNVWTGEKRLVAWESREDNNVLTSDGRQMYVIPKVFYDQRP